MFLRKFVHRPEFLMLVDDSSYMYMFGGMSQILYVVCEQFKYISVNEVLYHTQVLQEALQFCLSCEKDCRVYSCVIYQSGWVYVTDNSFSHVTVCEKPFDVVVNPVFLDAQYVYDKALKIMDNFSVTHNECACFSMSLLLSLVNNGYYVPDMFADNVSFIDRFGAVEVFVDIAHQFGVQVFTEMCETFDVPRVISLLDESYILVVELDMFVTYPFKYGSDILPSRHMCILFKSDTGEYGLIDTEGIRKITLADIEKMNIVTCERPGFQPWYDGCMLMGVRLNDTLSDIHTLKKHITYIHTSSDCEPLVFESFSKYSCGETHFWL